MADPNQKNIKSKILVVDDEPGISNMLRDVLTEEGYDVDLATSVEKAEASLKSSTPDLILLDLSLPDRSGYEILKQVRKKDEAFGLFIPVIVLTGIYTKRNDKVECLNMGADDFLPKPFDLIELMARVKSLIRLREMYKRSQYLATHDHLTRCYNRRYLMDFLNREMARFKRYKVPLSFALIDMDHFKQINDQFGHEGGDQALTHIGFRLQDFFRAVDCVARLGGDEFAAVLPDCSRENAQKVGERLISSVTDKSKFEGLPADLASKISISVGVACVPDHSQDAEELVRMADEAMYLSKKSGRGQFVLAEKNKQA